MKDVFGEEINFKSRMKSLAKQKDRNTKEKGMKFRKKILRESTILTNLKLLWKILKNIKNIQ